MTFLSGSTKRLANAVSLLALIGALSLTHSAKAQSYSVGVTGGVGGSLSYSVTYQNGTCPYGSYTMANFSNFVYHFSYASPIDGHPVSVSVPLRGSASYIVSPGTIYCPPSGPEPSFGALLLDSTEFFRAVFTPQNSEYGSASMESISSGAIEPDYVVMTVLYAPPLASVSNNMNTVTYTDTTTLGTSESNESSFTNSVTYTETASLGYLAFFLGATGSQTYTQTEDSTTSYLLNQTATDVTVWPGTIPPDTSALGINHNNDEVVVWLNAVLDCMAEGTYTYQSGGTLPAAIQCIDYDSSLNPSDPDSQYGLMDTLSIPVYWLNNPSIMTQDSGGMDQTLAAHGITTAIYPTIAARDPFYECGSSLSCESSVWDAVYSTRYNPEPTIGGSNSAIQFFATGGATQYTTTIVATSSEGISGTDSYSVSTAITGGFSFKSMIAESLKQENTLTFTDKSSALQSKTVGQTITTSITAPSSPFPGEASQDEFGVFLDNVYGSAMYHPLQ